MTQANYGSPDPNARIHPAPQQKPIAAAPASVPLTNGVSDDDLPHRPADDREEVYYEGSPLLRGEMGTVFTYWLAALIVLAIPVLLYRYKAKISFHVPLWADAVFLVIAVILFLVPTFVARSVRYRITNYRIDYERGMLSKNIDSLELWHVEDVSYHQSFWGRLTGLGSIRIVAHDDVHPQLIIRSVPNSRHLFETLKQRVISVKRQRGVMKVDTGM